MTNILVISEEQKQIKHILNKYVARETTELNLKYLSRMSTSYKIKLEADLNGCGSVQ